MFQKSSLVMLTSSIVLILLKISLTQSQLVGKDHPYVKYKIYYDLDGDKWDNSDFLYDRLYDIVGSKVPFGYKLYPYTSENNSTKRKAHACGVKHIKELLLEFLECIDTEVVPDCTEGYKAAGTYKKCLESGEGDLILQKNQRKVKALKVQPTMNPWVTFNHTRFNPANVNHYVRHLRATLCTNYNNWPLPPNGEKEPAVQFDAALKFGDEGYEEQKASLPCQTMLYKWKKIHLKRDHLKADIYYDALCPAAANFFLYQIIVPSVIYKTFSRHFDFDLIPFGHSKMTKKGAGYEVSCPKEKDCTMMKVHACTIKHVTKYSNKYNALRYLVCYHRENVTTLEQVANCAPAENKESIVSAIQKCAGSEEGQGLLVENGKKTEALQPPLKTSPWIVVNRQWSAEPMNNLIQNSTAVICAERECEKSDERLQVTGKERSLDPK